MKISSKTKKNYVEVYYLPCSLINKTEFINQMKDLYTLGSGSLQAWIAATGFSVQAYMELMNQEVDEEWDIKYKPSPDLIYHLPSDEGGRPSVDNPTNQSTIQSKSNNANKQAKPSDA